MSFKDDVKGIYERIGPEVRFDEERGILQIEDSYFLTRITEAHHILRRYLSGKKYNIEIVSKLDTQIKELSSSEEGSLENALRSAERWCEALAGFKVNAYR